MVNEIDSALKPEITIFGSNEELTQVYKSDSEEEENGDPDLLSKSFSSKCSTKFSPGKKLSSLHEEDEEDSDWEAEGINGKCQSIVERRDQLVDRLRLYNSLFKFHKSIKEDQVYLYRNLQEMDELYLRNTAAILRLGFCPCLVHEQTSPVGDVLMKIHRKLRVWDKKTEEICDILKEPSSRRKTTAAVLRILKICETSNPGELDDLALPEIVWDLNNPFLDELNTSKLTEDWFNIRKEVRESLCKAEMKFQEICLEFGITRRPAQIPDSEPRSYVYENVSMNPDTDHSHSSSASTTLLELEQHQSSMQENADDHESDVEDDASPNSKLSSSFF